MPPYALTAVELSIVGHYDVTIVICTLNLLRVICVETGSPHRTISVTCVESDLSGGHPHWLHGKEKVSPERIMSRTTIRTMSTKHSGMNSCWNLVVNYLL